MTLNEFLIQNRAAILKLSEEKTVQLAALRPVSDELKLGLPIFFDQLSRVLFKDRAAVSTTDECSILESAGSHGKELLRLGYTLSHVVHAYGAICQSITGYASLCKAPITAQEFHNLNRCLDIAIAGAVTEFESVRNIETKNREVEHMGSLAHELRNALNRATIAAEMMVKGIVGPAGSTGRVLQHSLSEMTLLLNRSLADIKLRAFSEVHEEVFLISEVLNQLVVTAEVEAGSREQTISMQIDTSLEIKTDRHLILSALGNIIQNAIKYTRAGGNIFISARADGPQAIIEVKDECGGIAPEKFAAIFKPFTQVNDDKSGLGLGLTIVRKSIALCGGEVSADNTARGCVFRVSIPLHSPDPISSSPV